MLTEANDEKHRLYKLRFFCLGLRGQTLITTNVMAHGIDVKMVGLVINYDSTNDEEYIHRIGRTGRLSKYFFRIIVLKIANKFLMVSIF